MAEEATSTTDDTATEVATQPNAQEAEAKRVSDSLCAEAWFTSNPRIGWGKPRLVG